MRFSDTLVAEPDKLTPWSYKPTSKSNPLTWGDVSSLRTSLNEQKEELKVGLNKSLAGPIDDAQTSEQVGVNLDPIMERLSKSYFMSESVNPKLLLNKANKNTLNKKLQPWADQLNQNAEVVRKNMGIKVFFDQLKDVPCVIVAAGPSLKNAIARLKTLQSKAVIICLGPTMRPMVSRGIYPHFVNAHDANGPMPENNFGGGPKFFRGVDASKTVALFVNYIHPMTIAVYNGPKAFYYVDDPGIPVYKTMALACDGPDRPDGSFLKSCITGGSSVAHTALYCAIRMGCNPITFVGLDLSYPDLTNSHFESDNAKSVGTQRLIPCETVAGRKVFTNLPFYSYKTVFDSMAPAMVQHYGINLNNSSQNDDGSMAGIVHAGLEPMPFDEWVEKYAQNERPELNKIQEIVSKYTTNKEQGVNNGSKL